MSKRAREEFGSNIDEPLAKDIKIDEGAKDSAEEASLEVYDGNLETRGIKPDAPSHQNSSAPATAADDNASLQSFLADLLFGKIGKGWHPLDFATWAKNQSAQDYFINRGYCTREERSALSIHHAVIYGDKESVEGFLRDDPSSIESINDFGHNPLAAAITMSNKEIVNCLLDNGADIEGVAGEKEYTPLATAINCGDLDMVALLLDRGADIDGDVSASKDCTPLIMALGFRYKDGGFDEQILAAEPNIEIAKLLIERGADLMVLLGGGHSAVSQASFRNLPKIMEALIEKGGDFRQNEWTGEGNIALYTYKFKAHDSMQWLMQRLQKPADQYDKTTMDLAFQVIKATDGEDALPISFLYEALSHDTDDKLMLREFEKLHTGTLLEYALLGLDIPNDDACLKDKEDTIVVAVLATNGKNGILLRETQRKSVIALLDFFKTNIFFVPSCSIIVNDLRDIKLSISPRVWHDPKFQVGEIIKPQIDRIKEFLKVIDFVSPLDFPPIITRRAYDSKPKCYKQIIEKANSKIHKMIEDNIQNGQWLISYFNDMKFTDASEDNMRDPGWIICEYLGANVQRIMEANKSNLLSSNPSFIESGSEPSAAACSSSYSVTSTGESEDTSIDG